MDKIQALKNAIEFAKQNTNSPQAIQLRRRIEGGMYNIELEQIKKEKSEPKGFQKVINKVADVTGGKELGQGLAQAINLPRASKQLDDMLEQVTTQQSELLAKRKEIKAQDGDTSAIDKALKINSYNLQKISAGAEAMLNPNELTNKQVIGDALQLFTTIAGAGTVGKTGTAIKEAQTFGQGLVQGAKTGAISGGVFGAGTGASQALQEDKGLGEVAIDALKGGAIGGITGGLLGGITGGVSGGIRGRKLSQVVKKEEFVNDLVMPKATTSVKEQALREGRITEQGLLNASKITPSKRDLQLAEAVKDVVNPKKSLSENIKLIENNLDEINSGVKAYISSKKVPFNTNQLTSQLNKGKDELKLIFAGDKQAERTYTAVVKEFLKNVKSKDTAGLFEARQKFDSIPAIKKLLDSQGLGENVKKEIVLTVRGKANEYITILLPKGNKFRDTLLKESRMIEAIQNIAEKGASSIDKNKLQELTAKYPVLKAIAGGIAGGLGLGAVGVGSSIIGSSD